MKCAQKPGKPGKPIKMASGGLVINQEIPPELAGIAGGAVPVNGSVAQIAGPGTGKSDSVPAKVGNTEFKVSNREGIAVLPEKTMATPGAVEAMKYIIEKTNGLPPKLAIASGVGFANGLVEEEKSKNMTGALDAATKAAQPAATPPSAQLPSTGIASNPPLAGLQSATRPMQPGETGVEMIDGIRHSTVPAVSAGKTVSAVTNAAGETANRLTGGIFDFEGRAQEARDRQRAELEVNPAAPATTASASTGIAGGIMDGIPNMAPKPGETAAGVAGQKLGRDENGIITKDSAAAAYANPMGRSGGIFGTVDMKGTNQILARENAIRQSMIDSQIPQRSGGGGYSGTGIAALSNDQQKLLGTVLTPHPGSMNGQLTANQLNAARGIMADANLANMKGAEIAQRSQEAASREAIENRKLGAAMEGQQLDNQQKAMVFDLQQRAAAGDAKAAESLKLFQLKRENEPSVRDRYLPIESETTGPGGEKIKTTSYVDPVSGKTVGGQQAAATTAKAVPKEGEVRSGYRFKGGDPGDQGNWERV